MQGLDSEPQCFRQFVTFVWCKGIYSVKCRVVCSEPRLYEIMCCTVGKCCQKHLRFMIHLIVNSYLVVLYSETSYGCQWITTPQFKKLGSGAGEMTPLLRTSELSSQHPFSSSSGIQCRWPLKPSALMYVVSHTYLYIFKNKSLKNMLGSKLLHSSILLPPLLF